MAQIHEAKVGKAALTDMQVGITWQSTNRIISVCLDGRLLFWDDSLNPLATVDGTQGPLTCVACEMQSGIMVRGGNAGSIAVTLPDKTDKQIHIGKTVSHVITRSASVGLPAEAWVIAVDGILRRFSLESSELVAEPIDLGGAAIGAAWLDSQETHLLVMSTKGNLHAVIASGVAWTKPEAIPRPPTAFGVLAGDTGRVVVGLDKPDGVVGGVQSSQFDMHLLTVQDSGPDTVTEQAVLSGHINEVTVARFHPSGDLLASADAEKNIFVWKLDNNTAVLQINNWCMHTARVTDLEWMPGGRRLVSGSLDRHVFVWDADAPSAHVKVLEAHKGGVSSVAACSEKTFASVGFDGFTLIHELV
jgi:WD40 repeat protein